MENRNILIAIVVLLLVACLLICCAVAVGSGIYFWNSGAVSETSSLEENPTLEEFEPAVEENVPTPTVFVQEPIEDAEDSENEPPPSQSEDESISDDVARQMDEIQMQVILERGLKPSIDVERKLFSSAELRQRVLDDFLEDYTAEEARNDSLSMAAFGLLEPDFDLYTFYTDLLSEQVAGFYDQETGEMVVVQGESFGGPERLTYAHEYTHALQDQNYDLEDGINYNEEACETDSERCAAIQALIEGDASLSELNWFFSNGTAQDQEEIMEFFSNYEMPVYNSAPEFITMDFSFPYEYGLAFVQYLHDRGGWGTVDRAYNNLPQSTEQILHPERYPDDEPIPVSLPDFADSLGQGWEEIDRGTMGEWYTFLILAKGLANDARIDEETAAFAAEGWGGDAYVVYYNADTDETIMVLHTTWDTLEDADEFATTFSDYLKGRFGPTGDNTWQGEDGYHTFFHDGDSTTWILAPNAQTLAEIGLAIP